MNSLRIRIISALIALGLLFATFYFLKLAGLKLIILFVVIAGARELKRVLFADIRAPLPSLVFYVFSVIIFLLSSWHPSLSGLFYSFFFVCFCVVSITLSRNYSDLGQVAGIQSKAALGFFYIGLLPSFAVQLIELPSGLYWFVTLLAVVFAGDIGAFIVGLSIGDKKIMPSISPKKTFEGALGGLCFSLLAGLSCSFFFPDISKISFCILSVATGVIAQFGDYFESLLKRVANVKDSGGLMPGHGGVLDRIDGVLFGCPIILLGAIVLEKLI